MVLFEGAVQLKLNPDKTLQIILQCGTIQGYSINRVNTAYKLLCMQRYLRHQRGLTILLILLHHFWPKRIVEVERQYHQLRELF